MHVLSHFSFNFSDKLKSGQVLNLDKNPIFRTGGIILLARTRLIQRNGKFKGFCQGSTRKGINSRSLIRLFDHLQRHYSLCYLFIHTLTMLDTIKLILHLGQLHEQAKTPLMKTKSSHVHFLGFRL